MSGEYSTVLELEEAELVGVQVPRVGVSWVQTSRREQIPGSVNLNYGLGDAFLDSLSED